MELFQILYHKNYQYQDCLLYTSDAADERSSVDLGGRRIIKKKTIQEITNNVYYHKKKLIKYKQSSHTEQITEALKI